MTEAEWKELEKLREIYLGTSQTLKRKDYWTDSLLDLYDQTFAKRIYWKCEAVFQELKSLGVTFDPKSTVLDWACGTGAASRSLLKYFPTLKRFSFFDRSRLAMGFSAARIKEEFPQVELVENPPDILLVSHAVTELPKEDLPELIELLGRAQWVILIEPGTTESSTAIIAIREALRDRFRVVAPCTHGKVCGLFQQQTSNWCHFHAPVPVEVFQSAFWKEYSLRMKIDLRSLPVSFLALSKEGEFPVRGLRVLSGSRFYKGYAQVTLCGPEGVKDRKLLERERKKDIKSLKKEPFRYVISLDT